MENGENELEHNSENGNGGGGSQKTDPFAGGSGYPQQGNSGNGGPQQENPFVGGNSYQRQDDPFAAYDSGYTQAPNNNAYGQPMGNQYGQPGQDGSQAMAIAGMVLGILSLVCCCSVYPALIMAVISFSLSLVVLVQKKPGRGMAIAGIVCSCIAVLLVIASIIISGLLYAPDGWIERFQHEMLDELHHMDM